ncbi:hypothetical protein AX14_008737 [Amanita brunnescens Koide BX004]|nr:hypothetical protein AX14_008737 [Amanita brunnescens Koide BX004]
MDRVQGVYQTTVQAVSGFAGPVINTVKHKFTGVAGAARNNVLPILTKSYADPLVALSKSSAIDDRESHLAEILQEYSQNYGNATLKDKDKINSSMVKLFDKMAMSQDPSAGAKDLYYKCVNDTATRGSDVTPELIYEHLLKSTNLKDHPRGISGLAFAFAAILALSLHREDTPKSKLKHNKTSPYFDLSPLYGVNEMETSSIRMKDGRGMLWPDSFTEDRLDMLPESVPALLVLWNRYHNYVAKQLLSYNEDNQWKDPDNLMLSEQCLRQDNEIFDVARSVTCIHFMNVIREDFLKGLAGMPIAGPSAQADILYDVRGVKNIKAGYLSSVESYLLYSFSSFAPSSPASKGKERVSPSTASSFSVSQFSSPKVIQRNEDSVDPDTRRRNPVGNLSRNKRGYFEDNDLAEVLCKAIEANAGCPGGKAVPHWAREQEISKLLQARQANVCTLNGFRKHLGLEPLHSFEDWNPELANTAHEIYSDINKLELYPGLLCERSDNCGFGFGYTMAWGLMADIVTRIRCDPMFTSNFKEEVLTKWGHNDCMSGVDANSTVYNTEGSLGGMLPKLLQRTLPHNFPYDNVYCLFPFVVPEKSKAYVEKYKHEKYKLERPKPVKIKILKTLDAIREILNDAKTYTSPYGQNLVDLTGGYGHMLGFDDLELHDHDLMVTLFSLMPDEGAVRRIGESFAQKAEENLQLRAKKSDNDARIASIDVVKDVIDATCIRWICETIYNFKFKNNSILKKSESDLAKAREKSQEMERIERDNFASYYAYVFRNSESEFGWSVRERALTASKHLRKHLREQLPDDKDKRSDTNYIFYTLRLLTAELPKFIVRLAEEYSTGVMLPQHSPLTFLDRMIKASHIMPLKRLTNVSVIKDRCPLHESKSKDSDYHDNDVAAERLEEERVIANAIGLAVVISVHFSKACAQAVDFYLDEKYSKEMKELVELCKNSNSSNAEIMAYIREAQRISQRFGLWRVVNDRKIIKQGFGYPDVIVEPGDRVFADFTFAHNDPKQFLEPQKVDLRRGREVDSLLGLGVHKCPAGSFIDQVSDKILRVIFKQEGLKRASGRKGQLKSATLHPNVAPWDSEIYLDEACGFTYYPKQMTIEFDSSGLKERDVWEDDIAGGHTLMLDRLCSLSVVIVVLILIMRIFISFSLPNLSSLRLIPTLSSGTVSQTQTQCGMPLTTIEEWHIRAFRPKWFGLFGEPAPIIYQTPRGRKAHQISVIDLDKRDIELQMWVDKKYMGSRDVELNSTVDCGEDIGKCINLDFGSALVVVPSGRHTVRAEIRKRKPSDAFVWGKERQRRVMWLVQACGTT